MIEQIEELGPEPQRNPFRYVEETGNPQIVVPKAGAAEDVSPCVAKCVDRIDLPRGIVPWQAVSLRSVRQQRAGVEPAVRAAVGDLPIPNDVRSVRTAARIAFIAAREDCEGRPGLESEYSGQLPASGDRVEAFFLIPDQWQIIHVTEHEAMGHVVIG